MEYDPAHFDSRCEWGVAGLRALRFAIGAVVVVDVLSFSTCSRELAESGFAEDIALATKYRRFVRDVAAR